MVSALIGSGPAPTSKDPFLQPGPGAAEALARSSFRGSTSADGIAAGDNTGVAEGHVAADPDQDSQGESDEKDRDEVSAARNLLEWVVVLGAAVAVALLLRAFVFQAFWIPSESMESTLLKGDRILVNKTSYRLHDVNRGDVVVFRRPDNQPGDIRDLVKRVIGVEGDTVQGIDSQIYVNDQLLFEPYLDGESFGDFGPVTVPAGEMFVMGDNRDESFDSRRFGTISSDRLVGRAFVTFWPFSRIGSL